jgi:hypothetical protein
MEAPIPQPRLDDDEDVHWALSTAVALWGRGERTEALKWLRRAAEQASDVNADKRALELFKAAAEVANQVKSASAPPPAEAAPPAPAPTPAPAQAHTPRPPPAPPPRQPSIPPRPGSMYPPPPVASAPPPAPARPPSVPAPPQAGRMPAPPSPRAAPPPQMPPPAPPSAPRQPSMPGPPSARPPVPVTPPVQQVAIKPAAPAAVAPKRRRSFTGEARPAHKGAAADPRNRHAAGAPSSGSKHRKRTHADDELHLPDRVQAQPATIFDDLDEDTRVISNKHRATDEIDQALERLRTAPAVPPAPLTEPMRAPSMHDDMTTVGPLVPVLDNRGAAPGRPASSDGSPSTERPASSAHIEVAPAPKPGSKRLDTLPALRVAVLGTGIAGEVRLISLDANDEPPPGAAVAMLVPLSGADGEAVARLFGAIE